VKTRGEFGPLFQWWRRRHAERDVTVLEERI
jgi:hypothetical protein